jgi:hypothetical protein
MIEHIAVQDSISLDDTHTHTHTHTSMTHEEIQAIVDDERMLDTYKMSGRRVLVICNIELLIDRLSDMLDHGATAEEMTKMGNKLFTDKTTFMPAIDEEEQTEAAFFCVFGSPVNEHIQWRCDFLTIRSCVYCAVEIYFSH